MRAGGRIGDGIASDAARCFVGPSVGGEAVLHTRLDVVDLAPPEHLALLQFLHRVDLPGGLLADDPDLHSHTGPESRLGMYGIERAHPPLPARASRCGSDSAHRCIDQARL